MKKILIIVLSVFLTFSSFPAKEYDTVEANSSTESQNYEINSITNQESIEEDLSSPQSVVTSNGENMYNLTTFDGDVQYKNHENEWTDIDTTLVMDSNGELTTKSSELDVTFTENIESEKPFVEVQNQENHSIEFFLNSVEISEGIIPIKDSSATTKDNQILYTDIIDNVDLRHIVLNNEVKEDIILNEKINDLKSINYKLKTHLTPKIENDGSISLFSSNGEKVYEMPAPHMSDSESLEGSGFSNTNYDIKYELKKIDDYYELKLVFTSNWLNEERTYPIYIDPTLVKSTGLDTFVSSVAPDRGHNQYWNSSLGEYVLRVGKYDATTGTNYGLVKLHTIDSLKGAIVSSAILKTYVNWSYYASTKTGLWVDRVTAPWSENNVTWNTRPPSINVASTTVARNQWASFNVTSAIQDIVAGNRTDYGFKFHTNGNETSHWKQLSASENGKNMTNLSVTYSYPQMKPLTTKVTLNSATPTNGYIDLSWPSVLGVKDYELQLFDGKGWQTVYKGASTSYSTNGKKIWPRASQLNIRDTSTGGIKFRNGDGEELPSDPAEFYRLSSEDSFPSASFPFRVVANYPLGSSTPSNVSRPTFRSLLPEAPLAPVVKNAFLNSQTTKGIFNLEWDDVEGATSYDLQFFNGQTYESIPVGNKTTWSSEGQNIFPTFEQLTSSSIGNIFRKNNDGSDFDIDASNMYKITNRDYGSESNYFVRVIAKSALGQSKPSPATKLWFPTTSPHVFGRGFLNEDNKSGHFNVTWDRISDAKGYLVVMDNGISEQIIDTLDLDTTFWSSMNKGLWPQTDLSLGFNTNDDVVGKELPIDPSGMYQHNKDFTKDDAKYYVSIYAFRDQDETKELNDLNRYIGLSEKTENSEFSFSLLNSEPLPTGNYPPLKNIESEITSFIDYPLENVIYNEEELSYIVPYDDFDSLIEKGVHIKWEPIKEALKYQLMLFNGKDYTYIDLPGNYTSWMSSNYSIFPTDSQLQNGEVSFQINQEGVKLPTNPYKLYNNVKSMYGNLAIEDTTKYYYRLRAILPEGSTETSPLQSFDLSDPASFTEEINISESNEEYSTQGLPLIVLIAARTKRIGRALWHIVDSSDKVLRVMELVDRNKNGASAKEAARQYMFSRPILYLGNGMTTRSLALSQERLAHILRRHDTRFWDGTDYRDKETKKYYQTFFPNRTYTHDIINAMTKTIDLNSEKINTHIGENYDEREDRFERYYAKIKGIKYQLGIEYYSTTAPPRITQFLPVQQHWYK